MKNDELAARAGDAETMLKALASRNRLMILCALQRGEHSVGDLCERVSLGQSSVSQHLARLRSDGLVRARREAQTIHYSLAGEHVVRLMDLLHEMFCAVDCPHEKTQARRAQAGRTS
ncbi:MAG: winged helix-turn-helix transcriptional regulator [Hyphomicrobiales bacterium]|nr:winged helix-turn-helix transcriptional regulator [Hyphomicrobiales bacterium]